MSHKNPEYLKFVRTLTCCHCGNPNVEPHHIIGLGEGVMADTASDIHTMPLCREHHNMLHENPSLWPQAPWVMRTQDKAVEAGVL